MMWLGFVIAYLGIGWDVCRRDRVAILESATYQEYRYVAGEPRLREVPVIAREIVTIEIVTRLAVWPFMLTGRLCGAVWRRWTDRIVRKWTS